jgi:hypothetical protein
MHRLQEPQSATRATIKLLEHTKVILQKDVSLDFEDHRAEAVQLIEEAIEQ